MCVCDHYLTENKAVQPVKDYITKHTHGAVKISQHEQSMELSKLIEHLRTLFESGKLFSSLLDDFYDWCQKPKETEDQFAEELQILERKVICVCPGWRLQVDDVLKTLFSHRLWDQYFAAMAHNLLNVAPPGMTFTMFSADCITVFGTRSRKAAKTTISTNAIKTEKSEADQLVMSVNQLCRAKKQEKIKSQTDVIEQQKKEIENLKATNMQLDPKNDRGHDTGHVLMYNTQDGPTEKLVALNLLWVSPIWERKDHGLMVQLTPALCAIFFKDTGN